MKERAASRTLLRWWLVIVPSILIELFHGTQVENPALHSNSTLTKTLTWNYLLYKNTQLLIAPVVLIADYSHLTIPVLETYEDPRNVLTVAFWVFAVYLVVAGLRR